MGFGSVHGSLSRGVSGRARRGAAWNTAIGAIWPVPPQGSPGSRASKTLAGSPRYPRRNIPDPSVPRGGGGPVSPSRLSEPTAAERLPAFVCRQVEARVISLSLCSCLWKKRKKAQGRVSTGITHGTNKHTKFQTTVLVALSQAASFLSAGEESHDIL